MDKALELFWQHGYDGVAISDLTAAIGIAAPSLYAAFGSKADLYREVLRRYGSRGMSPDEIAQAASSYEAARQMLECGIAAVTMSGRPLGCMVSSGMLMTAAENADLADELRVVRASLRKALEHRIARDIEEGLLPNATDAAALARFFATVLQGISVQALDGATAAELLPVAASALEAWPSSNAAAKTAE